MTPSLVAIHRYWKRPDILRQTPGGLGRWGGVNFSVDGRRSSDYVVIHGHTAGPMTLCCPSGNLWMVMGEPPNEARFHWHHPPSWVDRVYVTDEQMVGGKRLEGTAFLPWWVDFSFDELEAMGPVAKSDDLSWITSNNTDFEGHRYRMRFLARINAMHELRLFGRGFAPIKGKWEGLAPFRYSIAFENFSNSLYFSEKVLDCFLSWTMPIYYGCTDLARFFPARSFVQLDPEISDPVMFLRDVICSDLYTQNLDAIAEARRRVLYDYNLFNLISQQVREREVTTPSASLSRRPRLVWNHTEGVRQIVPRCLKQGTSKLRRLLKPRNNKT